MGSSVRKFMRPSAYFNIEDRALKQIEKIQEKPKSAPRHKEIRDVYENPDPAFKTKHLQLDDRLKKVRVESHGPPPELKSLRGKKDLPVDRRALPQTKYGFPVPENIRPGKVTLIQVMEFLSRYAESKTAYGYLDISRDYKLDPKKTKNVLKHFQALKIHVPASLEMDKNTDKLTDGYSFVMPEKLDFRKPLLGVFDISKKKSQETSSTSQLESKKSDIPEAEDIHESVKTKMTSIDNRSSGTDVMGEQIRLFVPETSRRHQRRQKTAREQTEVSVTSPNTVYRTEVMDTDDIYNQVFTSDDNSSDEKICTDKETLKSSIDKDKEKVNAVKGSIDKDKEKVNAVKNSS